MFFKSRMFQDSVKWAPGWACEAGWSRLLWQVGEKSTAESTENPSPTRKVFSSLWSHSAPPCPGCPRTWETIQPKGHDSVWKWTQHLFCRVAVRISGDTRFPGPCYLTPQVPHKLWWILNIRCLLPPHKSPWTVIQREEELFPNTSACSVVCRDNPLRLRVRGVRSSGQSGFFREEVGG